MRAILIDKYQSPLALKLRETTKPQPKKGEVLIKVKATAVNDYDWSLSRGKPLLYRFIFGLRKPRNSILGMELSGIVEELGAGVVSHKIGDAVFGDTSDHGFGSFAEYLCISANAVYPKPQEMSFEDAAALPHAALLALQGLKLGNIQPNQQILINGAGGGVGAIALQIAKTYQAEVTGVDTGPKLERMKQQGFDHVIDYKRINFTKQPQQYDLILDAKTSHSTFKYAQVLKPGGHYVTVGGKLSRLLQALLVGGWIKSTQKKYIRVLGLEANKGLDEIKQLYLDKKIIPVIDGPHPLEKSGWAIQHFGEGKHHGKVILVP